MIDILTNNRKLLKNFSAIISIDLLVKASNYLLLPIYLTLMLPAEYGLYVYLLSFSGLIASIGSMGMYGALNRYFYDHSYSKEDVISTLLILLVSIIFITILISLMSSNLWASYLISSKSSYIIIALTVFASLHTVLIQFIMGFFYIKKDYKEVQIYNIIRLVIVNSISLSSLYLFDYDATVERLVALVFSELLVVIFFIKYLSRYFSFESFNKKLAIQCIKFGYPLTLNAILGFVSVFADKYFIQSQFGFASVGEYVFIFMFSSLFGVAFSTIQNFWLPFFFNPDNKGVIEKRISQLFFWLLISNIFYLISVYIVLNVMFYLHVFDPIYENGMSYLWLLVLSQFFLSVAGLYNNYFSLYNKTINGLYVSLIMAVISLIVVYLLVSSFGVYGAALAVLVNSILALGLTKLFVNRLKRARCASSI